MMLGQALRDQQRELTIFRNRLMLSGLLIIVAIVPVLIWRLFDEEKFLTRNLPGYGAYQKRVRYRLIPQVW